MTRQLQILALSFCILIIGANTASFAQTRMGTNDTTTRDETTRERNERIQREKESRDRARTIQNSRSGGTNDTTTRDETTPERNERIQREKSATEQRERFQRDWELGQNLARENQREQREMVERQQTERRSSNPPSSVSPTSNQSNGQLSIRIRQEIVKLQPFGNPNSIFANAGYDANNGHKYSALNYLTTSDTISAEQAASIILFSQQGLHPLINSSPIGTNDGRIVVGKRFNIYFMNLANPVEVIEVTTTSFTVRTLPGHALQGTVTHEIIKDANNEIWLRQRGFGVQGEGYLPQKTAYVVAPGMWQRMAAEARVRLIGSWF